MGRVKVTSEELSSFLNPLIGSEDAIDSFGNQLRDSVAKGERKDFNATNPYTRLFDGLCSITKIRAGELDVSNKIKRAFVRASTASGGMIISILEVLGDIYEEVAGTEQDLERVLDNSRRVTRYATGMAHADSRVGMVNRWALAKGVNPNDDWEYRKLKAQVFLDELGFLTLPSPVVARNSLTVRADESGQLDIDFRYAKRQSKGGKFACPAAGFKIGGEGSDRQRYAVPTFSNVIGATVVTEIFPHIFDIRIPE